MRNGENWLGLLLAMSLATLAAAHDASAMALWAWGKIALCCADTPKPAGSLA